MKLGGMSPKAEVLDQDKVIVIHGFLSGEECAALIQRSESLRDEPGTVADVVIEEVRNNERVIVDDVSLATDFLRRAEPSLPAVIDGHGLVGFNERWRFYRYGPGQTFKPHRDGSFMRIKSWEESQMTFMIYLNDGMVGGETRFFSDMEQAFRQRPYLSVQPKRGMALAFIHSIWHEGAMVQSGLKYVLRTDVMYKEDLNV